MRKQFLIGGILLFGCFSIRAQVFIYDAALDTSGLIGNPNGPFSLDFQFIDGEGIGDNNNSVILNNFAFGTGGWVGTAPVSIMLQDNAFFTSFTQQFNPGTSLSFQLTLTGNADAHGVPDRFSLAILDRNGNEVPTTGVADAFIAVDFGAGSHTVYQWSTDLNRTTINMPGPSVTLVPELPETALAFSILTLSGVVMFRMRRELKNRSNRRKEALVSSRMPTRSVPLVSGERATT